MYETLKKRTTQNLLNKNFKLSNLHLKSFFFNSRKWRPIYQIHIQAHPNWYIPIKNQTIFQADLSPLNFVLE